MATICPYCDVEISDQMIESEDGCCPECGAFIALDAESERERAYDDEFDDYDDFEDEEFDDDFDDFDDEAEVY